MLTISDSDKYQRYVETQSKNKVATRELLLSILLFGSMGAITWAIRGTSGWGGVDGTIVPGLTCGLLWTYLCFKSVAIELNMSPFI